MRTMHGTRRRVSGYDLRRDHRAGARGERPREGPGGDDHEHVRERVIHSRGVGYRSAWRAEGLWRAIQGIWSSALEGVGAAYGRPLPRGPLGELVHGPRSAELQRPDSIRAIYEVGLLFKFKNRAFVVWCKELIFYLPQSNIFKYLTLF